MITLDPSVIGGADKTASDHRKTAKDVWEERKLSLSAKHEKNIEGQIRPESKGKNSSLRKAKRKQRENVINERSQRIDSSLRKEKALRKKHVDRMRGTDEETNPLSSALSRFS